MDWISVKDKPLIYTSPTGAKYPTEEGKKRFLFAVPYEGMHEKTTVWWISFGTLYDDCSIQYEPLPCEKNTYVDEEAAKKALKLIKHDKRDHKKPDRAYQCEVCSYWHLTSKPL